MSDKTTPASAGSGENSLRQEISISNSQTTRPRLTPQTPVSTMCHAGKDGECHWINCPQERDGEPEKSGRFCPLPGWGDDDE